MPNGCWISIKCTALLQQWLLLHLKQLLWFGRSLQRESPNGSLLTASSTVLISHLWREVVASVAETPGLAGDRSPALGGHGGLLGANQKTNGPELLERRWVEKPSHDVIRYYLCVLLPFLGARLNKQFMQNRPFNSCFCAISSFFSEIACLGLPHLHISNLHLVDSIYFFVFAMFRGLVFLRGKVKICGTNENMIKHVKWCMLI